MSKKFTAITIPDLHLGAIPIERIRMEIEETLYKKIRTLKELDAIIILGDLWDSKQFVSSNVTSFVIEFIDALIGLTNEFNTKIFIVEGTRTHDSLQLDIIDQIFNRILVCDRNTTNKRIEVISDVTELVLNGVNILFIPEEYIMDQKEYYKDTLYDEDKHYDFIFGHGMIDKIWYAKQKQDSMTDMTRHMAAPVFDVELLSSKCNMCYFGHVHMHKYYSKKQNFLYIGPITRWEFGKDDPVGFQYTEYDITHHKMLKDEFVHNDYAMILSTRIMNIKEDISLTDINVKIDKIIAEEMTTAEHMRLIININSKLENYASIRDFITTKIGTIKFVKLILSHDIDDKSMESMEEAVNEKHEQLSYLKTKDIDLEHRIQDFLLKKKNYTISIEDIKSIISDEDIDIKEV